MALFKISRGQKANLANQNVVDGWAWFTTDDGQFHIDAGEQRITVRPPEATTDKLGGIKLDSADSGKYLCGDGTWKDVPVAVPALDFDATTGIATFSTMENGDTIAY